MVGKTIRVPPPGPGDYVTELGGVPILGSLINLGVKVLGTPRTGKSSLIEGVLRYAAYAGKAVLAVDFEGGLDSRLRAAARYPVKRIDVSTRDGPVGIDWRNLWASESKRLSFFQKFAEVPKGSHNAYFDAK